jgi:hypothetical protein
MKKLTLVLCLVLTLERFTRQMSKAVALYRTAVNQKRMIKVPGIQCKRYVKVWFVIFPKKNIIRNTVHTVTYVIFCFGFLVTYVILLFLTTSIKN